MSTKLSVAKNPCASCPYRKDVPPGVWHESEYEKLRGYDDPQTDFATFLCHNGGGTAVCKGWLVVHAESCAARLAVMNGLVPDKARYELPTMPLYASGNEAADAGLKGIKRPGKKAREVVRKLLKRNTKRKS